jgi:hypothetical protein
MQNVYAIGLNQPLDATLRAFTTGAATSPLQLSTTSVSFGGASGLNWDNANNRLGIGTNTPLGILHLKVSAAATRLVLDGDAAQNKIITYRTAGVQRFGLYTNNTAESGSNAGSDFAIRAYSDAGSLLSTPIFIKRSSGNVGIGTTTANAKLHVTGDGTGPIARFENNLGTIGYSIENSTTPILRPFGGNGRISFLTDNVSTNYIDGNDFGIRYNVVGTNITVAYSYGHNFISSGQANTSGTPGIFTITAGTMNAAAGSGNFRPFQMTYTINNSGAQTGTATGIFLNATETALNGMVHNLMDLGTGGGTYVSRFRIASSGDVLRVTTNAAGDRGFRINAGSNIPTIAAIGSAGVRYGFVDNLTTSYLTTNGNGFTWVANAASTAQSDSYGFRVFLGSVLQPLTYTSLYSNIFTAGGVYGAASGNGDFQPIRVIYTLQNTGTVTGTATGIFLRSTETNLNGMLHNFIDLGTNASGSLFSVANNGAIRVATIDDANASNSSLYFSSTINRLVWKDAVGTVNSLY